MYNTVYRHVGLIINKYGTFATKQLQQNHIKTFQNKYLTNHSVTITQNCNN